MREEIEGRFDQNLARVRGLLETYEQLAGPGKGRVAVGHVDVLRAAVVLLHASMEDLLRSVSRWKLPGARPAAFKNVPFPNGEQTKHTLEELAPYRGRPVDDLFASAIDQLLNHSSYNNAKEIAGALDRIGITPAPILAKFATKLDAITARRHLIVHRVDMNPLVGSG